MMTVENGHRRGEREYISPAPDPNAQEVTEIVERHQSKQRAICQGLEQVADSLPLDVDPSLCMRLARGMLPALRSAHEYKEAHFYDLARRMLSDLGNVDAILERQRSEYVDNEMLAEEVAEELSQWGICAEHKSPEAMGYMLRGLFVALTRHLDFERVVLIEPIKTRLFRREADRYPEP